MEAGRSKERLREREEAPKKLEDLIADAESAAFGLCKISPVQFNQASIAELNAIIAANVKEMDRINDLQDAFNARQCEIVALCAGNKDAKLADFLIRKREPKTDTSDIPVKGDSPEVIKTKLNLFTASLGGKTHV